MDAPPPLPAGLYTMACKAKSNQNLVLDGENLVFHVPTQNVKEVWQATITSNATATIYVFQNMANRSKFLGYSDDPKVTVSGTPMQWTLAKKDDYYIINPALNSDKAVAAASASNDVTVHLEDTNDSSHRQKWSFTEAQLLAVSEPATTP